MKKISVYDYIKQNMEPFFENGNVIELRAYGGQNKFDGIGSGYFNTIEAFAKEAAQQDGRWEGLFFTPNACTPELLARANNKFRKNAKKTTADQHIIRRRWFLIDIDAARLSGISSTDEEHDGAIQTAKKIHEKLQAQGWTAQYILADSGNGGHIMYRIDLPNDAETNNLIEKCLLALDQQFTTKTQKVDKVVFNASRIWKVYGTLVKKGDALDDRPHRRAKILERGGEGMITINQIEDLAKQAPIQETQPGTNNQGAIPGFADKIQAFIGKHNIIIQATKTLDNGAVLHEIQCPLNTEHTKGAFIGAQPNGALFAKCHHNGCTGKTWKDFRQAYEPGCYEKTIRTSTTKPAQEEGEGEFEKAEHDFSGSVIPAFPLPAMPDALAELLQAIATSGGYPVDFIAIPVLAACSQAIGRKITLQIKEGFELRANIYAAVVATSGKGKSPAQNFAITPLEERQEQAKAEYDTELKSYLQQMKYYKNEIKHMKKGAELPEEPKEPILTEYYTTDTTTEALFGTMEKNPADMILVLDELSSFVSGLNQYKGGRGNDREHFLSIWSNRTVKINRKGRAPIIIPRPFLSIVGGIPPATLPKLIPKGTEADDGLIQRFLFAYPKSELVEWNWKGISGEIKSKYYRLYRAIQELSPEEARPMELTANAATTWEALYNANNSEMKKHTFPKYLMGAWGKMPSQAGRLAIIIHSIRRVTEGAGYDVDEKTLLITWELIDYFKAHACRVYCNLFNNEENPVFEEIIDFMAKRNLKTINARALIQAKICENATDASSLLEAMAKNGTLREIESEKTGKPGRQPGAIYENAG